MLIVPFNDLAAVEMLLSEHDYIAAIIAEPLQRIIPPQPGFLAGLRALCDKYHVLIFDEIVTGFRPMAARRNDMASPRYLHSWQNN